MTAYDIQKEDQAYRFKSHTKNSIVKSLSLDVSCAEKYKVWFYLVKKMQKTIHRRFTQEEEKIGYLKMLNQKY